MLNNNLKITKYSHSKLVSESMYKRENLLNKRAAMFGLDARIALAIFGALSVISGAALYSALQKAEVVSAITELRELGKAYEQYVLDTGSELKNFKADSGGLVLGPLIKDSATGIPGWKGPYISYEIDNTGATKDYFLKHPKYKYMTIAKYTSEDWWTAGLTQNCKVDNCYIFTRMTAVPLSLAEAIDKEVDGVLNDKSGDVRIYRTSATENEVWMLTGRAYLNKWMI